MAGDGSQPFNDIREVNLIHNLSQWYHMKGSSNLIISRRLLLNYNVTEYFLRQRKKLESNIYLKNLTYSHNYLWVHPQGFS